MADQSRRSRPRVVGLLPDCAPVGTPPRRIARNEERARRGRSVARTMGSAGGIPYAARARDQFRWDLVCRRTHIDQFQAFRGGDDAGCYFGNSSVRLPRPLGARTHTGGDGYLVRRLFVWSGCGRVAWQIEKGGRRSSSIQVQRAPHVARFQRVGDDVGVRQLDAIEEWNTDDEHSGGPSCLDTIGRVLQGDGALGSNI